MKQKQYIKKVVYAAMIAAAYTAISLALAPITYGMVQFRVAEAMTILPIYSPVAIWGLTLGCAITNFVGASTGANFLGILDVFIGTAATLVSAVFTRMLRKYRWKKLPILATIPPVLINAVVIGAEWCYFETGRLLTWQFFSFAAFIAAGQLGACTVMGLVLSAALEKSRVSNRLLEL